jgi:hypothetical protein
VFLWLGSLRGYVEAVGVEDGSLIADMMCWERYDAGIQVVTGEGEIAADFHAEQ